MTSKAIALKVLDAVIATVIGTLVLSMAGVPMEWLSALCDMSPPEFRGFSIFVIFAALWLMHAIVVSDSAP
jgi:ABC-type amino acid transport system permease subunit